jgi:ATP-dependent DNA helicase RecQ
LAWAAIKAAKDRGWESYRSIERYRSGCTLCRRRQILDHFGDPSPGAPSGRCCDVCDPDPALAQALQAPPISASRRRARSSSARTDTPASNGPAERYRTSVVGNTRGEPAAAAAAATTDPVDEREFEHLRQWRWARAEGKPAFTVAANSVLEEVLRRRPRTAEALLQIRGIGPAFCAKHGDSLLAELDELWADARRGETPGAGTAAIASVPAPT